MTPELSIMTEDEANTDLIRQDIVEVKAGTIVTADSNVSNSVSEAPGYYLVDYYFIRDNNE